MPGTTTYQLQRSAPVRVATPTLDAEQQAVVDHPGGPLLVLAGPGTGKTTTLVEAIVDRIERRGTSPEAVLALTFSRKAAEQLRDRVTARLGRTMTTTLSSTFHSFAYSLIRQHSAPDLYAAPLRLLSAPEQDVVLQEMLAGARDLWPDALRQAVGTRGFARELAAVLSRAREKGLDPVDLKRLGEDAGDLTLVAAARFLQQYQVILDDQSAIDYPELIHRAVLLAESPSVRADLRQRFRHVFVDEYQDTDASQVRLLRALAGDGADLTVVGDPHQSIYAFRGAEVRGILDFPAQFPRSDGSRADIVALRTTRRFGPRLLLASQRVAGRLSLPGSIPESAREAFRHPTAAAGDLGDGRVETITFDTERAESEHLADLLRRAHLEDGVPWSDMAVLVRSGRTSIPGLRRALGAAGVPVEVASDDLPLVREPAVLPLLDALRAVVHLDLDDPDDVGFLDPDRATSLLLSPLAGLDATEVRALARELRRREREAARAEDRSPRPSPTLLREALLDPGMLDGCDLQAAGKLSGLARLLRNGRARLDAGAPAEEVLWELWSGTSWPERLRSAVASGGHAARLAHRDLDAICALFETAGRLEGQRDHTGVDTFLATLTAQQIPADTLAERGVRGDAVRLLTAHRAKGLEWRLVVIAHVQEEGWPDLRRRATLLQADRIGVGELVPPVSTRELLAEERRLFYVAATRARQRLVVTAVASPDDDGEQPSRFLGELGSTPAHVQGRPARPLSLAGLVAELRRTVADETASDGLRAAAASRLARLAREEVRGRRLVPQADPATWWGTRALTRSATPLRPDGEPITISASTLGSIVDCPAKWFLEREAGGEVASTASQGFGLVVHAIADRVARDELSADPAQVDELMEHVDRVWGQMSFRTPWSGTKERAEVRAALTRFVTWHARPGARTLLATEQRLSAEVTLPDGQTVRLYGFADRLEIDDDGHVVVVDLKTGKYPPPDKDLAANPQLGLYQLAVDHGAADELAGAPTRSGGAELVQLRKEARGSVKVQPQPRQEPDERGHTPVQVQLMAAAEAIREERLVARAGSHCEHCDFVALCPVKGAGTVLS